MTKFNNYHKVQNLDLATEAHSLLQGKGHTEISGVSQKVTHTDFAKITNIKILNHQGEKAMGRPRGNYITIDMPELKTDYDNELLEPISDILGEEIKNLLPKIEKNQPILVVGLGNSQSLPDALGPKVVAYTQPTMHFYQQQNPDLNQSEIQSLDMLPLAAIAPNVTGNTGIETAKIVKAVVEEIQAAAVIVIDALAAKNISRIITTIQLTDTGIRPGSGVQNHRQAINSDFLGVPVIAIGMPTVVHAGMVINETIERIAENSEVNFETQNENLILETVAQILEPFNGNLLVTPKEVDSFIPKAGKIIAAAIAKACHKGATSSNISNYLQ